MQNIPIFENRQKLDRIKSHKYVLTFCEWLQAVESDGEFELLRYWSNSALEGDIGYFDVAHFSSKL